MSYRIACYTLFDITRTGVLNRARPGDNVDHEKWYLERNTQCNFDTILQAISLRSQPEVVQDPKKIDIKFKDFKLFGTAYKQKETIPCWTFEFEVQHPSVFADDISELGYLHKDCDGIPMIKCGTECTQVPTFLNTTPELKNIIFKKV